MIAICTTYDIQTEHSIRHTEDDIRTCWCVRNRNNSFLSYPTCS